MSRCVQLAVALGLLVAAGPALASSQCSKEMGTALENQRKSGAFRMDVFMIAEQGPVKMTVDYVLPDRMRQVVTVVLDPKPIETVLVGNKAWSNQGGAWSRVSEEVTRDLVEQVRQTVAETPETIGRWECLGKLTVEGQELTAYKGGETGPVDLSPDAAKKPKNEAVRIVYVDPATGLPARSIYARPDKLDRPMFKAIYTYPKDIKIEPPPSPK
jgi:hypothetical protein